LVLWFWCCVCDVIWWCVCKFSRLGFLKVPLETPAPSAPGMSSEDEFNLPINDLQKDLVRMHEMVSGVEWIKRPEIQVRKKKRERERDTHTRTHHYWTGTFARVFAASSSACAVQKEEAGRSVWSPDFSYSSFGWEQV
jgi:hypothetical protein